MRNGIMYNNEGRVSLKRGMLLCCFALSLTLPLFYFNLYAAASYYSFNRGRQHKEVKDQHHNLRGNDNHHDKSSLPVDLKPYDSQIMTASGQHLLLDMAGGNFRQLNDEQGLREATIRIVEQAKMTLLGIQSYKLHPQGVSVVATLAESHLSVHTWPEYGTALIDLFTCGPGVNLQEYLAFVVGQYGGNLTASTYSVIPRGEAATRVGHKVEKQFQPAEIMTTHRYKNLVFEVQSPYQHVSVWDHHDTQEDDFSQTTTRSLYLDGVIQSNIHDEEKYHESLVHPAFIGSAEPPKRVLIVGGGEGGTLRETLKWASVEKVVMVDLDSEVMRASREYLPSYGNCTGFGTKSCFDDPRAEIYAEDFIQWFDNHIGNDICETANDKKDELFDVIILDLLDTESLPDGEEWAAHLYSDLFFERLACATSRWGVLVTNFGEAPEAPFLSGRSNPLKPSDEARLALFSKKIEQIQTLSKFFFHTRVYDTAVPSYRANWAFAIGMAPKPNNDPETNDEVEEEIFNQGNVGINDFEGNPAKVNLKMKQGFKAGANTAYYDGAVQHGFQYPSGDWYGVYCLDPENKPKCDRMRELLSNTDYEEELFELRLHPTGDQRSGMVAKIDIPKGTVTGLWDAATSLEYPSSDFYDLRDRAKTDWPESPFRAFGDWVYRYGFDGGLGGTGEVTYTSTLSKLAFANHACDGDYSFTGLAETYPWTKMFWEEWNPIADRFRSEINHLMIAARDIKKGELITDDYTRWDGYMHNLNEEWGHPGPKEWCGDDPVSPQL